MSKYGELVFSKPSWGAKEAFELFGFKPEGESNLGAIPLAEQLLKHTVNQQGWVHLGNAIDEILSLIAELKPTSNSKEVVGHLNALWSKQKLIMEGETPNELDIFHNLLKELKDNILQKPAIGRKTFRILILETILNRFETV